MVPLHKSPGSKEGPQTSKRDDVVEEAKEEGVAFETLKRAKKLLGVKSYKERGKADGDWFWELPHQGRSSCNPQ
jgi:hypothetical protein